MRSVTALAGTVQQVRGPCRDSIPSPRGRQSRRAIWTTPNLAAGPDGERESDVVAARAEKPSRTPRHVPRLGVNHRTVGAHQGAQSDRSTFAGVPRRTVMSPRISGLLRPALRTTMAAGLAGAVVLGGLVSSGAPSGGPSGAASGQESRPTAVQIAPAAAVT